MPSYRVPERFEVLAELASTEAQIVLRAHDAVLDREVVLKVPGPGLAQAFRDRTVRQAGLSEARALARVRHVGVVRLFEVIDGEDGPVLVMDPLSGATLDQHLERERRLPAEEVLQLGLHLTDALAEVHAAGLVHRGICAASIHLAADGLPTLAGFHFTKAAGPSSGPIPKSSILYAAGCDSDDKERALPEHPAPEQIIGQVADARSDLFGLGWVLYQCLTGEDPFEDTAVFRGKTPRDPLAFAPDCPRELGRLLVRCLSVDPAGRPDTARALHASLAKIQVTQAGAGRPIGRRAALAGVAGVALLGTVWTVMNRAGPRADDPVSSVRGVTTSEQGRTDPFADTYGNSYAFLIGISEAYSDSGFAVLSNAERDVAALAENLRAAKDDDWEVTTLLGADASRAGVIDSMSRLAERTEPEDRVFIYYAGHGEAHPNSPDSGWMIPADAQLDRRSTWVRFDEFFRFFDEARAKHILIAMDCCYGGRLAGVRSGRAQNFAKMFLTRRAHLVVASGRGNELVSDGLPGEHSPFAKAFLDALQEPEPLTSSMLFARIQESFTTWDVGHSPQFGHPEGAPAGGEFVFFK